MVNIPIVWERLEWRGDDVGVMLRVIHIDTGEHCIPDAIRGFQRPHLAHLGRVFA